MAWDDFTEWEKSLDHKISELVDFNIVAKNLSQYNRYYNLDKETIDNYIAAIGAAEEEREYIRERIKSRMRLYETFIKTGSQIQQRQCQLVSRHQTGNTGKRTRNILIT